jgi:pimeloyl-ACP methyl ester carboxylesterase
MAFAPWRRTSPRRAILGAGVLACIAVLAWGLAACGRTDDEAEPAYRVPSLSLEDLHPCTSVPAPPKMLCGAIKVPLERRGLSLGETRVAFAVRPREERDRPSLGTIVAVEGGPGYASSWTARSYVNLFGSLLRRREMVTIDMRGTGRSGALDCPDLQRGRAPDWIALSACARKLGPLYGSYRTSAAADDINDVRRALGLGRITLYGDSYGSFLGQSYAFRHPQTLNALVLDSAYPARGESPWYPTLISTGVRSISIACERSPSCSGDAGKRLRKLVHWLRKRTWGVGPLIDIMFDAGYDPPDTYLRIDRAGTALRHGDADPYQSLIAEPKAGTHHLRHYSTGQEEVVSCNDYPLLWDKDASEQARRRQLAQAVRSYRSDVLDPFTPREVALSGQTLFQYCLTAPRPSRLYEPPISPEDRPTKAPVLVVSGELDSVTTPYEGSLVADEFPDGRHFVDRGAGHVADLYDATIPAAVRTRQFLRNVLGG